MRRILTKNDNRPCPFIFTGCKTSINPVNCYWTNSFILQGGSKVQANLNPYKSHQNIKMTINIE